MEILISRENSAGERYGRSSSGTSVEVVISSSMTAAGGQCEAGIQSFLQPSAGDLFAIFQGAWKRSDYFSAPLDSSSASSIDDLPWSGLGCGDLPNNEDGYFAADADE